MAQNNTWSIDRHIPIALILAIFGQTIGAVWFAAKMDSRVESLEHQTAAAREILIRMDSINSRLVRIETLVERKIEGKNEAN